jgi:uncharacterized protein
MNSEIREFQVFVKPVGARCNLSCSYCYYLDKRYLSTGYSAGCMNHGVLELYIRQHIEASAGKEVIFSWHGGEPTLAGLDFYRKVVDIQKRYKPSGSVILNGIQTNATLLSEEWGKFLKEENFYAGVSLDGPESYHNLYRRDRHDNLTYQNVIKGLEIIRKYNIPFEILAVISDANVHAPLEVYHFLKKTGAAHITFLPLVEKGANGNQAVRSLNVRPFDFGRFLSDVFDEWLEKDIGIVKVQIFEEALRTAFNQEHTLCIFKPVCGGVPVVEMNGDFYSCDHYVNEDHLIGNIGERSLADMLDDPRQKTFGQHKLTSLPRYCLECEVLSMCNGECPKNRFVAAPTGEDGLNYLCEGYRYFFNHCRPFIDEVARVWKM